LPVKVAFVIIAGLKREEGSLAPILSFFVFVVLVGVGILALGYSLSLFEEQSNTLRCRMTEGTRQRRVRRQRVRCRFEG
jgi:hypothetical protein